MSPHKKPVYKPVDAKNPFTDGGDKAYAEILADKMKETQKWRHTFYVNIILFAIALVLFFNAISRQQTIPVLVNVMPSGESQYLGEVRQNGSFEVPEAAIHFQIRTFVHNLRSVSTDYQVLYSNIDDCFQMVTSAYSPIMRNMLINSSPFELVGKLRRTVEIESVLHVTGRSYQINWTESVIESQSSPKNSKMRAVATVRLVSPTDATIKRNPLGIYIENFEMTELK
jgi:type IV secretion system protein VirB5